MKSPFPWWNRNRRELYVLPLRQRLLSLPIPLRPTDSPARLDLQALVDQAYASGRYDDLDYSAELDPPLAPDDAEWARAIMTATHRE